MKARPGGQWVGLVVAVAALLSLPACGDATSPWDSVDPTATSTWPSMPEGGLAGWVGGDWSYAVFVLWTEDASGTLAGTLQVASLNGSVVEGTTRAFSGTRTGSDVTLTFDVPLDYDQVALGEVTGDQLTLYWPSPTGELAPMTLQPGSVGDFNQRVAELRMVAADVAADQVRQAEADQAIEAAEAATSAASSALGIALSDFSWDKDLAESWLQDAENSLQDLREQVQLARDQTNPEDIAWEAEMATWDWEYLASVLEDLADTVDDADQDLTEIEPAIGVLEGAIARRVEVEEQFYDDATALAFDEEERLIQEARAVIRDGAAALDGIRGSAAAIDSEGLELLAEARSLCSC